MEITPGLFIGVAFIALVCEYVDVSFGGGYGTILSPALLIIGFAPLDVVPAVLLGQLAGGVVGGYLHHRVGNINLDFRRDEKLANKRTNWLGYIPRSLDAKIVLILAASGIIGGSIGAVSAINIPTIVLRVYIGLMVMGIGALILIRRNHKSSFTFRKLAGIGLLSAFNKGISGGGYGPLVAGGQLLIGREAKSSIGSAITAESVVVIAAFLSYVFLRGGIYWTLAAATSIGSVIAAPLGAITVKKLGAKKLKVAIGAVITILGALTLVRIFIASPI